MAGKIVVRISVKASPSDVLRMFTNSTAVREWLADMALIAPRPGGRIYLAWNDGYYSSGSITSLDGSGLAFSWRGPGEKETQVEVSWTGTDDGTVVEVRQGGFASKKKARRQARNLEKVWARSLENLASVLDSGEDLRFTRRPMLGVTLEEEVRDAAGGALGVRISGTVEGMGAAAAGLIGGDVIAGMAGREIREFSDLGVALSAHRAGDLIEVRFLRQGEEQTLVMELSGRPIGDVKASAVELADQAAAISDRFLDALDSVLAGTTEEEATYRPGEDEWSVKEILAHLLDGEGDDHARIVAAFDGVEPLYDGGFANSHWRTSVTAGAYPDVASMMAAYRRLAGETVQLIRAIPPELERKRPTFWRIAYGFSETEHHLGEHLDQIKATLAASRQPSST